jgi:hypothetical protein
MVDRWKKRKARKVSMRILVKFTEGHAYPVIAKAELR